MGYGVLGCGRVRKRTSMGVGTIAFDWGECTHQQMLNKLSERHCFAMAAIFCYICGIYFLST